MFVKVIHLFLLVVTCCVKESVARTVSPTDSPRTDLVSDGRDQIKEFGKVAVHSMECTKRKQGKLHYDVENGRLLLCYHNEWREMGWKTTSPQKGKLPTSCLDAKLKNQNKGDGLYWINPEGVDDLKNAFLAYCDMTTSGGGWTLVAKITDDYAWICPERKGANCLGSKVDPLTANLFHSVHTRDFVDLTITSDENSGIHLKNSIIRKLFMSGRQSVRFTYVTASEGWTPSEDAYAAFNSENANKMFLGDTLADYSRDNGDYTWNVLRHERQHLTFSGSIICWGMDVNSDYRYYDQGLHAGTPTRGNKKCHLSNDENQVMLKSHYARLDSSGRSAEWDRAQFGFLGSKFLQAPCQRIALWVR